MHYSTKLARENNWLDYDSISKSLFIGCFILCPLIASIIILYLGTDGFNRNFRVTMEIIGMFFGLAIILTFFYYIFKITEPYEKGFIHKSYEKVFRLVVAEYLNAHYSKDPEAKSFKSPTSNYDIVGLYVAPDDNINIQVQSFSNPPFQKEEIIDIRIGPITKNNYRKAENILRSIDQEYNKHFSALHSE